MSFFSKIKQNIGVFFSKKNEKSIEEIDHIQTDDQDNKDSAHHMHWHVDTMLMAKFWGVGLAIV